MAIVLEAISTRYAIEIDDDQFFDLLASESHITDNAAYMAGNDCLSAKLDSIDGVSETDYGGHLDAAIYMTIDAEANMKEVERRIAETIDSHFEWCAGLKKAPWAIQNRAEEN